MGKWLAAAAMAAMFSGCKFGASAFSCTEDSQCLKSGTGGTCEAGFGLCSFADSTCPDPMRRFGDLAGDHSGQCVGGQTPGVDAGVDVPVDAQEFCYGTGIVKICLNAAPTQAVNVADAMVIDTTDAGMCAVIKSGAAGLCVIVGTTITLSNSVRGVGSAPNGKPLVFLASDTITSTAAGVVDVASYRLRPQGAAEAGAGSDPTICPAGTAPTARGGGAGGSFAGTGGKGGGVAAGNNGGTAGAAITAFPELRGGCAGQDGQAAAADDEGVKGHGGGAVYFIAGTKIELAGDVRAGGEGGGRCLANQSGAGGGGSGGMIGLDAPTITVTGSLIANGGSGGEGCSQTTTPGRDGTDGATVAAARFDNGGNGASQSGGDGGDGSATAAAGPGDPGKPGTNVGGGAATGGGGGGGGGAGLIKAPATANLGTKISPARTP